MNELLPCPFCGSEMDEQTNLTDETTLHDAACWAVFCYTCGSSGAVHFVADAAREGVKGSVARAQQKAIESWNQRQPMRNLVEKWRTYACRDLYVPPEDGDARQYVLDTLQYCADELNDLLSQKETPARDEPRTRPLQGGWLEKDTLTGEVQEPVSRRRDDYE